MNDLFPYNIQQIIKAHGLIYASCTRASIKTMAMQSKNMECMIKHKPMIYSEEDFLKVIEEESIGYNDVVSMLYHN